MDKEARLSRDDMPGALPGQSQIGKQERSQLNDGKARRDVMKNMRGAAVGGRRPLLYLAKGRLHRQ
jgi:hypothetical protein